MQKVISILTGLVVYLIPAFWGAQGRDRSSSVDSVTKVSDGFYMMDYTYDYDIDELMARGVSNTVDLILYGATKTMLPSLSLDIGKFACTTFNAVNSEGDALFARNYDYMEAPCLLLWTHPSDGYESIGMVDLEFLSYDDESTPDDTLSSLPTLLAPYVCVDGMNEKGLSIGVLELETDPTYQRTSKPNLTTTTMIRAVLDKAATVGEAIAIFKAYDMHDALLGGCTYHYQIADASGKSVVIEYVDNKMNIIKPENSGGAVDYIAAANFYLSEGADDPDGFGQERAEAAMTALDKTGGVLSEAKAMDVLRSVSVDNVDWDGYICSTLWSAVYNTDDRSLTLCARLDYDNSYVFSVNNPLEYTVAETVAENI